MDKSFQTLEHGLGLFLLYYCSHQTFAAFLYQVILRQPIYLISLILFSLFFTRCQCCLHHVLFLPPVK